jgi:hypothetical protein
MQKGRFKLLLSAYWRRAALREINQVTSYSATSNRIVQVATDGTVMRIFVHDEAATSSPIHKAARPEVFAQRGGPFVAGGRQWNARGRLYL